MKKNLLWLALAVVALLCISTSGAQIKTSYFMEGSVQRYDMNAALTPMYGYLNFPLLPLGNFGMSVNNNFFSVDNLVYPRDGGHVTFMHESVDAHSFLRRVPRRASISGDINYNLIGFGKYNRKHDYFWSVGLNVRGIVDASIPKEVFRVLKDLRNGHYEIPDITVGAMAYSELALGFTMPMGWKNLVVGGRLKLLMGLGQAEARLSDVNMTATESEATAEFSGTIQANISGMEYGLIGDGKLDLDDILDFDRYFNISKGFRSYGAAIDIGAEIKFLDDRLKASFALNDLGFIAWGKTNSIQGELGNMKYVFRGIDLDTGEEEVEEEGELEFRKTGNSGYTKRLSTTMNIGVEYDFLDGLLGVGLLSHTRFSNGLNYSELTLIGTVRPCSWFTASVSQSIIHNRLGILGFAINFHPRGVNIFLGTDYIPMSYASLDRDLIGVTRWPVRAKSLNCYIGLAFGLGGKKPW